MIKVTRSMQYQIDYYLRVENEDGSKREEFEFTDESIPFVPHKGLVIAFSANDAIDIDAKVTKVTWFHDVGDKDNLEAQVVGVLKDWSKIKEVIAGFKKRNWTHIRKK